MALTRPAALIAGKSTNLDQSNITVVVDFPGALFPVSVISVFFHLVSFLPSHHVIQRDLPLPFHF